MTSVAVTFADETAGGHVANLMFQKNAFALGMAPLAKPVGGAVDRDHASYNFV